MAKVNDGGPAFPRSATAGDGGMLADRGAEGMTTRAFVAAKALASLLVTPAGERPVPPRAAARTAVEYADALLAELTRPAAEPADLEYATAEALNGRR